MSLDVLSILRPELDFTTKQPQAIHDLKDTDLLVLLVWLALFVLHLVRARRNDRLDQEPNLELFASRRLEFSASVGGSSRLMEC